MLLGLYLIAYLVISFEALADAENTVKVPCELSVKHRYFFASYQ